MKKDTINTARKKATLLSLEGIAKAIKLGNSLDALHYTNVYNILVNSGK